MHELSLRLSHAVEALVDPPDARGREFAEAFDAFAREMLPDGIGRALEGTATFPEKELESFAKRGLIDVFAPDTADWAHAVSTAIMFSAHEPDVLLCLGGTALGTLPVVVAGDALQRASLARALRAGKMAGFGLSEWRHGLDILGNDAAAEPLNAAGEPCGAGDATQFRLSGTKAPVNNATRGAIVTVLVRTAEGRETNSQSLFMIERDKTPLAPGKRFESLGYRNMDLSSIVLDGVMVPASAVLGKVGEGFHHARRSLEISRGGVASMAAGLAIRAFAIAAAHALERSLYGAKVIEIPAVTSLLAQSYARIVEATALARFTGRLLAHATVSSRHATCAAKLVIPQLLEQNVHDCGTVLGARSLLEDLPFARLRRTAPVHAVFDGSTPLQREELWRSLITWRAPGTLSAAAFRERFDALTAPAPSFDAYRDDSELAEAMTPPALLAIAADLLGEPMLESLASAAMTLSASAPSLRRASSEAKHAASDAAGALYALSALAMFTAGANESRRSELVPALRMRAARARRTTAEAFEAAGLPEPASAAPAVSVEDVAASMQRALSHVSSQ